MAMAASISAPASIKVSSLQLAPESPPSALKSNTVSVRGGSAASAFLKGQKLQRCIAVIPLQRKTVSLVRAQSVEVEVEAGPERFRLNNLSPQPGSRKRNKRKGRGIAAGQGASCGFGMRGQKSRSGSGVRPGFEGGQMPLYRRLPKLKGIAGGMGAGLPKFVTVNIADIAAADYSEGEEVSLETLIEKRIINPSGRDARLRLKVLGEGELNTKLTIKAGAFSESAKLKLELGGSTLVDVPGRKKWVKPSVEKSKSRADEYFAKKRASPSWVD